MAIVLTRADRTDHVDACITRIPGNLARTLYEQTPQSMVLGCLALIPHARRHAIHVYLANHRLVRRRRQLVRMRGNKCAIGQRQPQKARNLALRHSKKHRHLFLWIDDLDFELPDKTLAETRTFQNERDRQLYAALDKLKPEYREAVYLIYLEEMSYRNAAAVMSKSEQQIKNLVYRGKQSLKAILEQEGFEYADE